MCYRIAGEMKVRYDMLERDPPLRPDPCQVSSEVQKGISEANRASFRCIFDTRERRPRRRDMGVHLITFDP